MADPTTRVIRTSSKRIAAHLPTVIIFRDVLLPLSETFIRAQKESLSRFNAVYSGCKVTGGVDLGDSAAIVVNHGAFGKAEELLFRSTGWAPRLAAKLKRYDPLLLHAHFGPDGAMALPLARQINVPLLVTFHGYDATLDAASFRESRWGRRYLRRLDDLKRGASAFIAVSDFVAKRLVAQGFPAKKIFTHYIGVDAERFAPDASTRRGDIVLFVGRLVEKKGCEFLIRAMESVQRQIPDTELVIIGDGPLRDTLELQAKASLRKFRFLGAQSQESIARWMKQARVLCAPSIVAQSGDAEGFGIVFIESQASGLPVVSFASGGIPEAVAHGVSGYLAAEKDWRQVASYIATLLQRNELWERFSRAGQERVRNYFDLKKQTAKLESIYDVVALRSSSQLESLQ
jgi:glycosyltransferase involved in cell wall biosynthesis